MMQKFPFFINFEPKKQVSKLVNERGQKIDLLVVKTCYIHFSVLA